MKINFTKRGTLIITALVALAVIVGLWFLFSQKQTKQAEDQVSNVVESAVDSWGNYTDESNEDYLNSIKPYYSGGLYDQAVKDAEQLKKMSEKFGPNLSSAFTITTTSVISSSTSEVKYKISGTRKTQDIGENYKQTVIITFNKIGNDWKITDIEEQKQDD